MKIDKLINRLNSQFNSKKMLRPALANSCYNLLWNTRITKKDIEPYLRGPENEFLKLQLNFNENYNLYLVRWGANHELPRHGHGFASCIYKLVDGELKETLFTKNNNEYKSFLKEGEVCYIDNDMGEHSVKNMKNDYSYSLHLYFLKE